MFKMILNLFTRQKWKLQISSSQYFIVNTLMLPELLARIHFSQYYFSNNGSGVIGVRNKFITVCIF